MIHEQHIFQAASFDFVRTMLLKQLRAAVWSKPWVMGRSQHPEQPLFPIHEGVKDYAENFRPANLTSFLRKLLRTIKQLIDILILRKSQNNFVNKGRKVNEEKMQKPNT